MIRVMLTSPLQPDRVNVDFYFDDTLGRKELEYAINDRVARRVRWYRRHNVEIYVLYYGEKAGKRAADEAVVRSAQDILIILRKIMGATAKFLDKLGVMG